MHIKGFERRGQGLRYYVSGADALCESLCAFSRFAWFSTACVSPSNLTQDALPQVYSLSYRVQSPAVSFDRTNESMYQARASAGQERDYLFRGSYSLCLRIAVAEIWLVCYGRLCHRLYDSRATTLRTALVQRRPSTRIYQLRQLWAPACKGDDAEWGLSLFQNSTIE